MIENIERNEIVKTKRVAIDIINRAIEKRAKIFENLDVDVQNDISKIQKNISKKYVDKDYSLADQEVELQASMRRDIEEVKSEYEQREHLAVDFLISQIIDVKVRISPNIKEQSNIVSN